jgi:hypothetical protein
MAMQPLKNVFDDKEEFEKLRGFILQGIQNFSEYRKGNLTYGEIMFVLECVLDSLRETSEQEAQKIRIKGLRGGIRFSTLLESYSRLVEVMVKKKAIDTKEEAYILHGED